MNLIVGEFSTFYCELFWKTIARTLVGWEIFREGEVLSSEEQSIMIQKVTKEKIKVAIFGIGNEKAPGPDGFPAGFF